MASKLTQSMNEVDATLTADHPLRSLSGFERDFVAISDRGRRFVDISGVSGVDSVSDGRAAAFADFDNDGDLDILMTAWSFGAGLAEAHGRPGHYLFRNDVGQDHRFIRIALEGRRSGRDAFGTEVRVKSDRGVATLMKSAGSGYISEWDPRLLFGLGMGAGVEWIEVKWAGGKVQRYPGVPRGSSILLIEDEPNVRHVRERRTRLAQPRPGLATTALQRGDRFPRLRGTGIGSGPEGARSIELPPRERVVVAVWATWCAQCERELPELQELGERLGVRLIGLSVDDRLEPSALTDYVRRHGIEVPSYVLEESSARALFRGGVTSIPMLFLVDEQGRIADALSGWNRDVRRRLIRWSTAGVRDRDRP